jgi:hypothetical protein
MHRTLPVPEEAHLAIMLNELLLCVCTTIPSDAAAIEPTQRLTLRKERVAGRTEARGFETLLAVPIAEEELHPRLTLLPLDVRGDAAIAESVDGAGRRWARLEAECGEEVVRARHHLYSLEVFACLRLPTRT